MGDLQPLQRSPVQFHRLGVPDLAQVVINLFFGIDQCRLLFLGSASPTCRHSSSGTCQENREPRYRSGNAHAIQGPSPEIAFIYQFKLEKIYMFFTLT
jgi:hypothetical protein